MNQPRPAEVRFYVDADVMALAKVLVPLRSDVTYPGDPGGVGIDKRLRPACPITTARTLDVDWIPVVAQQGWVVITRDRAITRNSREKDLVTAYGARMVILSGNEARTTFAQLEIVMSQWRRIEACRDETGPVAYSATRTSFNRIDLDS